MNKPSQSGPVPGLRRLVTACLLVLLMLTACRSVRTAADALHSDFSVDPRQQGWVYSDWSLNTQAVGGWSAEGYVSLPAGFAPFWVSPQFVVAPFEFFRITVRSRGPVGLCGVGCNRASTWGRYPNTNSQGLLAADDWTVLPSQPGWQTNDYCCRALVNVTACGVRLSGGDADCVSVDLVSRGEVRAWADATYAAMPPLRYVPPRGRFHALQRTRSRLRQRQDVTVVFLGDSIMNDTCNSTFDVLLERAYGYDGSTRVRAIPAVGGGAGMDKWAADTNWNWPQTDLDLQQAVIAQQPDLVVVGGISNGTNSGAFQAVIDRVVSGVVQQFGYIPEILLMTGAFGTGADPPGYADHLHALAVQLGIGFMDMRAVWLDYVTSAEQAGVPRSRFYRDATHANHYGKQLLGRALLAELSPDLPRIVGLQPAGTSVRVTLETEPGQSYSLWTLPRLGFTPWVLATNATATGATLTAMVDEGNLPQAFYRVSTP